MGTNLLYTAWKRELLLRATSSEQKNPHHRPPHPPVVKPQLRPQSARWQHQVAPQQPLRPQSARTYSADRGPESRALTPRRPADHSIAPKPVASLFPLDAVISPCRGFACAEKHFREGRFGLCRDELERLVSAHSLPPCCTTHKLMTARVALLSDPKNALSLYDAMPSGSIPDGEWNCANNTATEFAEATSSRQNGYLGALLEAFSKPAPSIAACFLVRRARRCIADGELEEALGHVSRATKLNTNCCDSAICHWLLTFALDERFTLQSIIAAVAPCDDPTHVFCQGSRHIITKLSGLLANVRTQSSVALASLCDEFLSQCDRPLRPKLPRQLIEAVMLRVQHAKAMLTGAGKDLTTSSSIPCVLRRETLMKLELMQSNPGLAFCYVNENCLNFPQFHELRRAVAVRFVQARCQLSGNERDVFGFAECSKSTTDLRRRKRYLSLLLHPDKWAADPLSADVAAYCFRWMTEEYEHSCRTL